MRPALVASLTMAMSTAMAAMSALPAAAQDSRQPVTLRFAALVGDKPAKCGERYPGIGTTRATMQFEDLRFYVSDLRLVTARGEEVPVRLKQDGAWQFDDVALLDFEDATGACSNGTSAMHDTVEGFVPNGEYAGLRFLVGLPFFKNHVDPTLQPAPLNVSQMFWTWNAGYKFMRIDLKTAESAEGWMVHLGSTGCVPRGAPTTVPERCEQPNAVTVDLRAFNHAADVVTLDVAKMLGGSDLTSNVPKTALGCMSSQMDADCGPLFERFGLAFADRKAANQSIFDVRRGATSAAAPR